MANFDDLKAAIANVIKDNGNQEITGTATIFFQNYYLRKHINSLY